MSKKTRGRYYQNKTKQYFEDKGYSVYNMEQTRTFFTPRGMISRTHDVAGADLMCMNGEEIIFIQCKTNPSHMKQGERELEAHPYPDCVKRLVIRWKPRAKTPEIRETKK